MNEYLIIIFKSVIFSYVNTYAISFFMNRGISSIRNQDLAKLIGINLTLFFILNKFSGFKEDCKLPDINLSEIKSPKLDIDSEFTDGKIPSINFDGFSASINYFKFIIIKIIIIAIVTEFGQLYLFKIKDQGYKMEWFTTWFGVLASTITYDLILNQFFAKNNRDKKLDKSVSKIRRLSFILLLSKVISVFMMGGNLTEIDQQWFISTIFAIIVIVVYVMYFEKHLEKSVDGNFKESIESIVIYFISNFFYNLSLGELLIDEDVLEVGLSWSVGLMIANIFINNFLKKK